MNHSWRDHNSYVITCLKVLTICVYSLCYPLPECFSHVIMIPLNISFLSHEVGYMLWDVHITRYIFEFYKNDLVGINAVCHLYFPATPVAFDKIRGHYCNHLPWFCDSVFDIICDIPSVYEIPEVDTKFKTIYLLQLLNKCEMYPCSIFILIAVWNEGIIVKMLSHV